MANPNKRKGDAAERAARDYLTTIWPTIKTRAGFNDDLGDLICDIPAGRLVVQVKDVASPRWKDWFTQLAEQVETCRRESDRPVIGGIILWKTRGVADPARWRVVSQLEPFIELIGQVQGDERSA